jgi:hypothetical protein
MVSMAMRGHNGVEFPVADFLDIVCDRFHVSAARDCSKVDQYVLIS